MTELTLPNSVKSIGDGAFADCSGLEKITVESGNSRYDSRDNCNSIIETATNTLIAGCKNSVIPNSVASIWYEAFRGCTGLTKITLPDSVKSIERYAFQGCSGLEKITVESGNSCYDSRDNCNSIIETETNTLIAGCKNSVIPNSVTSIGDSAFEGCTGLTELTLPDSVMSIGKGAFRGCTGLTELTLPKSVKSIWDSAFYGCTGLTELTLSNSLKCIEAYAFSGCRGITKLTLPNSVTRIGNHAFDSCSGLTELTLPDNIHFIEGEAFSGCTGLTELTLPDNIYSIGNSAFCDCTGLTKLTLSDSLESIDGLAFCGCSGLTELTLPNSVTSIGNCAFGGCSGLTELTLPNSVTSIGDSAFECCSGLTELTLPDRLKSIREYAFAYCSGLAKITSLAEIPPVCGSNVFYGVDKTNCELIVPEGSVAAYKQTKVWSEFRNIMGFVAFGRCGDSIIWTLDDSGNLTLSGSGEMWNYSYDVLPFKNYGIKKVTIGCGIASIGNAAFSGCTGLEKITSLAEIPPVCGREVFDGVNKTNCELIVPEGSVTAYKEARGWKEFSNISWRVVISGRCGDSITWTLYDSGNLTLSGSGEMWNYGYGTSPFKDYGIRKVTIGDGITSIGDNAFGGCRGLTELILPNSVRSIWYYAFLGCSGLAKITSLAEIPPVCDPEVFDGVNKTNCELIVPEGSVAAYTRAEDWNKFSNIRGFSK